MTEHYFGEVCGSQGCSVSYSCINTKSADVKVLLTSSIFLPVPSRPPCRSASHHIQLCRLKGLQSRAPVQATSFRTPVLMRVKCSVSMPTGMHHAVASHMPAEQHYLSVHRQPREYIILSLHSDLDGKYPPPPRLHNAKLRYMLHARLYRGLWLVLWIMQHDIVWLNAPIPNWIPTYASTPPCLDKYWWKITASALIKEMEHFDLTLN